MIILNIESSTDVCSVCLSDGNQILAYQTVEKTNQHAAILTRLVEQVVESAAVRLSDLAAVAVSNGPGSYTSLRVGISTAKGLCFALKIPLIAVDTLGALANEAKNRTPQYDGFVPMIDARRMEVYCAIFEKSTENPDFLTRNSEIETFEPKIIDAQSFENWWSVGKKIVFCGNGAAKCEPILNHENILFQSDLVADARWLVPLSAKKFAKQNFVDMAYHVPEYGKLPNITTPKKIF